MMASLAATSSRAAVSWMYRAAEKAAVVVGLALLVGLLSFYQVEAVAWVSDSYERIADAERMLSGQLPASKISAPGAALVLVPFFILLPHSVETIQLVSATFTLSLTLLIYFTLIRLTKDRFVSLFAAIACCTNQYFLLTSRSAMFDTVVAFLVVLSVFVLPALRGRSLMAFCAYGILLSLIVAIRPLNIVVLLPLLVYWVTLAKVVNPKATIVREVFSGNVLACASVLIILTVASILTGSWYGNAAASTMTFERVPHNILFYVEILFYGFLGVAFLGPPALLGARELWRFNRPLFNATITLIFTWLLAFTPFYFVGERYMLAIIPFVYMLIGLGISVLLRGAIHTRNLVPVGRFYGLASLSLTLLLTLLLTAYLLDTWPQLVKESDEGRLSEIRPVLAQETNFLLVSTVARGFRDLEGAQFFDIVDQAAGSQDRHSTALNMVREIDEALNRRQQVYYLYTHFEAGQDFQGDGRDGYELYFRELTARFSVTELFRTESYPTGKHPWLLFKVQPK